MYTCTFFGHRDAPDSVRDALWETVTKIVREKGSVRFLVGNEGFFDKIVQSVLFRLQAEVSGISAFVVLSSLPNGQKRTEHELLFESLYPEEVARAIPRFRIDRRNRWMLKESDCVITYVRKIATNTQKYHLLALRQKKTVLSL